MADDEKWMSDFYVHLAGLAGCEITPEEMAFGIHEALQIAQAEKYATDRTRFLFKLGNATADDVRLIRSLLTRFENSVVVIVTEEDEKREGAA
jgi:hypothetical protein